MRPTVVIKAVFAFVLLNGVAVSNLQAASFIKDYNSMSNSCEALKAQLGTILEKPSSSEILAFGNGLGVPALITDIYFDGVQSARFGSVTPYRGSTESVNVSTSDGLMTSVSNNQPMAEVETGLTNTSDQPKAVPFSAVAWLFSSALVGFVVMANRRKV
jgi:hypothetical protein